MLHNRQIREGGVMMLSDEEFRKQLSFEHSLSMLRMMLESGLITHGEFMETASAMIDEYKPIIRHISLLLKEKE